MRSSLLRVMVLCQRDLDILECRAPVLKFNVIAPSRNLCFWGHPLLCARAWKRLTVVAIHAVLSGVELAGGFVESVLLTSLLTLFGCCFLVWYSPQVCFRFLRAVPLSTSYPNNFYFFIFLDFFFCEGFLKRTLTEKNRAKSWEYERSRQLLGDYNKRICTYFVHVW